MRVSPSLSVCPPFSIILPKRPRYRRTKSEPSHLQRSEQSARHWPATKVVRIDLDDFHFQPAGRVPPPDVNLDGKDGVAGEQQGPCGPVVEKTLSSCVGSRGRSRGQGQGQRPAAQELTEEVEGTTSLLPAGPPDASERGDVPHSGRTYEDSSVFGDGYSFTGRG
jgi:hypothetical protein